MSLLRRPAAAPDFPLVEATHAFVTEERAGRAWSRSREGRQGQKEAASGGRREGFSFPSKNLLWPLLAGLLADWEPAFAFLMSDDTKKEG